ncbi:MAG TPA: type VI secretion system contractile sheath protein TssC, partial [Cytophagaceae bacterium]
MSLNPKSEQIDNSASSAELKAKGSFDQQLKALSEILEEAGGFEFLESTIEGLQNLNPDRKARKQIFLNEEQKKGERQHLLKTLEVWSEVLGSSDDAAAMVANSEEKSMQLEKVLHSNVKKALDRTRELEKSYRSVALFYKNTEQDKIKNVSIMNAELDQLKDLDFPKFIDKVQDELKSNFDRLDLRDNYSMLVVPGYLGSNKVIEKWAKIAHENKVMLVTDFGNFEAADDVMELFESANLTGGDKYRSNVLMTCNWLVGRGKVDQVGEEEDLYVPPSAAYAGKIYNTLMSQVAAGKKHGGINEVDAVRFDLKKSEIANIEKLGLIPRVSENGKVMAISAKT